MYVPPEMGIGSVNWSAAGDLEVMSSTFGLAGGGAGLPAPADWAEIVHDAFVTSVLGTAARINVGYTYVGTEVRYNDGSGFVPYAHPAAVVGTRAQAPLPSNCAMLIRKRSAMGGRANQGRMYFPPAYLFEGNVDLNGNIDGADVTAMQVMFNDFMTELNTGGLYMQIFHTPSLSTPTEVTQLELQSKIATQRRRMR